MVKKKVVKEKKVIEKDEKETPVMKVKEPEMEVYKDEV